uniref:Uncharacterized protein n=1 Tax=Glossina palpalis gambiensis TaxID=67801 RepID=A0A1B0BKY4_9MUSC
MFSAISSIVTNLQVFEQHGYEQRNILKTLRQVKERRTPSATSCTTIINVFDALKSLHLFKVLNSGHTACRLIRLLFAALILSCCCLQNGQMIYINEGRGNPVVRQNLLISNAAGLNVRTNVQKHIQAYLAYNVKRVYEIKLN